MNRGSTWNRWDLHVHSPASYEGDFGPPAEDDTWRQYTEALISAVREHGICAISIQDYFTTKGYEELIDRDYYDPEACVLRLNGDEVDVLIIPGMEIRFNNFVGSSTALNAHLYFDPNYYSEDSIRSFLGYLPCFTIGDQDIYADPNSLVRYGYAKINSQSIDPLLPVDSLSAQVKYDALYRAASEASIPRGKLKEALSRHKNDLRANKNPALIAIAGTGHGAVQEYDWEGRQGPIRKNVTRQADMVLSSNAGDRKFYLGKHDAAPPKVLRDEIGGFKPCIWGSDAHDIETLLHPSAGHTKRYTWIKAEPTFEGLRQIQFEPESRVVIQEENPQQKSQYRTIQQVSLSSSNYADCEVCFNHDLSVIIGGKSTGKSLLLYAIAATMDRNSASERHPEKDGTPDWYDGVLSESSATVCWDDGREFSFDVEEPSSRAISYIPQSYINRLAEDAEELNSFVLDVLTEKEAFRQRREQLRSKVADQKEVVQARVRSLNDLMEKRQKLKEELRGLGDEEGIESEIDRLKNHRNKLTERSGLSDKERVKFENLKQERNLISDYMGSTTDSVIAMGQLETATKEITELVEAKISSAKKLIEQLAASFVPGATGANSDLDQAFDDWLAANEEAAASVLQAVAEVEDKYDTTAEALSLETERIDEELQPLEEQLELREELERVEGSLRKEKGKLSRLKEINEDLTALDNKRKSMATEIAEAHAAMFTLRQEGAKALREFLDEDLLSSSNTDSGGGETSEYGNEVSQSLKVVVHAVTEGESLAARVSDMLDGRRSAHQSFAPITASDKYEYTDQEQHVALLEGMIAAIVDADKMADLGFREGYDASKVISSVTDDWFDVQYSLSYDDESVTAMSPGKRGMVLLQFLLERSDAEYPILLDQPEDNLDNRTIFDHVVKALRHRKTERQIIVVTHNPNLVVATDAEQVVVAKQSAEQEVESGVDRFQYASGALESSRLSHQLDEDIDSVRDWVCEILEGGPAAFQQRQTRYNLASTL